MDLAAGMPDGRALYRPDVAGTVLVLPARCRRGEHPFTAASGYRIRQEHGLLYVECLACVRLFPPRLGHSWVLQAGPRRFDSVELDDESYEQLRESLDAGA